MTTEVIFFDNETDLEIITGTTADDLWKAGFNLDDMDWGFVSPVRWKDSLWWEPESNCYYMYHILTWMEGHCVGYNEVNYKGKWYYTLHHS